MITKSALHTRTPSVYVRACVYLWEHGYEIQLGFYRRQESRKAYKRQCEALNFLQRLLRLTGQSSAEAATQFRPPIRRSGRTAAHRLPWRRTRPPCSSGKRSTKPPTVALSCNRHLRFGAASGTTRRSHGMVLASRFRVCSESMRGSPTACRGGRPCWASRRLVCTFMNEQGAASGPVHAAR